MLLVFRAVVLTAVVLWLQHDRAYSSSYRKLEGGGEYTLALLRHGLGNYNNLKPLNHKPQCPSKNTT